MAMSFALAGFRITGVRIANPSCVDKTYPRFFDDLEAMVRWLLGPHRDRVGQNVRTADARRPGSLEQLLSPLQQRDTGSWGRIARRAGIIGLEPGVAVLADHLFA